MKKYNTAISFTPTPSLKELRGKDLMYNWDYFIYNIMLQRIWQVFDWLEDGGYLFTISKDTLVKPKKNEEFVLENHSRIIMGARVRFENYKGTWIWVDKGVDFEGKVDKRNKEYTTRKYPSFCLMQDFYYVSWFKKTGQRKVSANIKKVSALEKKEYSNRLPVRESLWV